MALLAFLALATAARAEDWPTYRHDIARSGVTAEELRPPLAPAWVRQPRHAPQPAWRDPNPRPVGGWHGLHEGRRVQFDDAYHVAVADGVVFFGSSADGKVTALDAATGQERWSVLTDGPVRLAPTVAQGKVYVASDDGHVTCLQARDGKLVWRVRLAPAGRQLLGNGQMISRWPLRTGVLVDDGVAYAGAGIFPAEGVFLYALNAETGKVLWCNDSAAAQPQSRISPQGYLLASSDTLFTPMGRVPPAAFDRKSGRLLYETYFTHYIGGTYALLAGEHLYTGTRELVAFHRKSRARFAWYYGRQLVVTPEASYVADGSEIRAVDRQIYPKASLRRKGLLDRRRDLARHVHAARRTVQQRQAAVKKSEQAVQALDKKIAKMTAQEALAREIAEVKRQRARAQQQLDADRKALDSARHSKVFQQMDQLKKQLEEVNATLAKGTRWTAPSPCAESLILAGGMVFAGGDGQVDALDAATGEKPWTAKVQGKARGLAVAGGRLFVSTDTGAIYCFAPQGTKNLGTVQPPTDPAPFPRDELTPVVQAAARHIVQTTGLKKGYALVLGAGTGRLALELARLTDLHIYGVESDPQKVAAARKALDKAGLHGTRVRIDHADPARVPYADYFANLIVSESALLDGQLPPSVQEARRMLRPCGGALLIGQPQEAKGKARPLEPSALRAWAEPAKLQDAEVRQEGGGLWLVATRGPLPGAGGWTHQYAEPGNTACSDDVHVKCPLGLLWFGDPGPTQMAERHRRAAAPLSIHGRFFVLGEGSADRIGAGENAILCYDAYNGTKLWERRIRGALRVTVTHDGGNSAVNDDSLFIAVGDRCLRLDQATGETKTTYKVPPAEDGKARSWGYVAVSDGRLYGTRSPRPRTADCVFAVDLATGARRWAYEGEAMPQSAIAIGDGRVLLARGDVSEAQRREALADRVRRLQSLKGKERAAAEQVLKSAQVQRIVALDAATGKVQWDRPVDLTGAIRGAHWCSLGAITNRNVLILFGTFLDGHYWKEFFAGQFGSRRVVALDARDGSPLWSRHIGYRVRPLVVGDTLHAEPWAYDLRTGQQKTRSHPITGQEEAWQFARPGHHCGCPAASPNVMLFRSYCLGWYDLVGDYGTQHFGSQRPGCWINFIPANGLLVMPEASSGCMCPFPNACTVVFQPREENRQWAWFSSPGPLTPVKHLALNLGAPGDRRAADGTLWLGYPRPGGSLVLQLRAGLSHYSGWATFRHDPERLAIEDTPDPWLYRHGIRGLRKCVLPLVKPGDGAARYTVRLAFAEVGDAQPGQRRFAIQLQGKTVAEDVDVVKEAGGPHKALVKEFKGIEVDGDLVVDLLAKAKGPSEAQMPVLQGIEAEREAVLSVGLIVPAFQLSNDKPEQERELRLANHKDQDFAGTLRIEAPDGFAVAPATAPVKLSSGQTTTLTLKATVARKGPRGKVPVTIHLLRADGQTEWEGTTEIDYLASLGRVTLRAVEDTYARHGQPDANKGGEGQVAVDGGNPKFGDQGHAVAYLKFRYDLRGGKPRSVLLRLHNAGNPTGDSGRVCLVTEPWTEKSLTYNRRPKPGTELVKVGRVSQHQVVELALDPAKLPLQGKGELSLAIDPTGCDGVNYLSREGGKPAELVIEYEAPDEP